MTQMTKLSNAVEKLPALYATDGAKGDLPAVYVFTPDGSATWILWEYDSEDRIAFGMCDLGLGFPEMGYVSITELEQIRGGLGLPVEIDSSLDTRWAGYRNAGIEIPARMEVSK